MSLAITQRRRANADGSGTQSTDMLLNLVFVLLFLVGGRSLLAPSGVAMRDEGAVPGPAIEIFVEDDGKLHFGSLSSPHVSASQLEAKTRAVLARAETRGSVAVVVHHVPDTPAGDVHAVLRAVQPIPGVRPLLALGRYAALPCRQAGAH